MPILTDELHRQRKNRFYVVADGLDPLSGNERRRWHPIGHDRDEAEAVRRRLELEPRNQQPTTGGPITLSMFLNETWMPRKRRQVRATTAYRYAWFIKHYITPVIGDIPLRRLRVDHLENLYEQLAVISGLSSALLGPFPSGRCPRQTVILCGEVCGSTSLFGLC